MDPVDPARLKQGLWHQSHSIGFQLMRVCAPDAALPEAARHRQWLERGHGADIHYLYRDPEARYDARSLLPECRSVVVLALSYYNPVGAVDWKRGVLDPLLERAGPSASPEDGAGAVPFETEDAGLKTSAPSAKIAMYAWGDNYHSVIRAKLKQLGRWLDTQVSDHRWRLTVDSAPLAEKAFAVAAGMGWQGRNSLVLNRELGSYFFLACLLTSAELPRDEPAEPGCGTCTLCIQACPTQALLGPGILAAERCTSYHNTESQAAPTPATQLNGWLFGCDTCQQVCPYNKDAVPTAEPRFAPRSDILNLTAPAAAALSEAEFNRRFEGTSIRRRKFARFTAAARNLVSAAEAGHPGRG